MPVITAQQVIDKAEIILQDNTNIRWLSSELLGWLNDAMREIVKALPSEYTKNENVLLIAGTRQTLPSDAIELLDVPRNAGAAGTTPGNAITFVHRKMLDEQNPAWHAAVGAVPTQHYMRDERDQRVFYVFPPQPAVPQYVNILYSASPTDIAIGATLWVDDVWSGAIIDYILYRAYSKDAEYTGKADLSSRHESMFMKALETKVISERMLADRAAKGTP